MWEERPWLFMLRGQLFSPLCPLSKYLARWETLEHLTIGIAGKGSDRKLAPYIPYTKLYLFFSPGRDKSVGTRRMSE